MMAKKTVKQLEEEVKKLIKVNNSNFVDHQKTEHELHDVIHRKDEDMDDLSRLVKEQMQKI